MLLTYQYRLQPNQEQAATLSREHLIFVKTLLLAPSFFLLPLFSWLLTPDS
jgi:hypothetical protein